jgi:peptide/nickel transport system ATP-binding protein
VSAKLLEVKHLRVEFNSRRGTLVAIDDVSFEIAPGEVLGVVGESGAGKSITGTAIIGLLEPPGRIAGGEILLEGRRIDNLPPDAMRKVRGREIGAIFQDPLTSLNPLYTVGRQLTETIQAHLPVDGLQVSPGLHCCSSHRVLMHANASEPWGVHTSSGPQMRSSATGPHLQSASAGSHCT